MSAFFPILETLLKRAFWYRQQLLFRLFFYLLNHSKTLSFHQCLQFWEEEKVGVCQGQWMRWLRHDFGFVQILTHEPPYVTWCVIMVQNPWLDFPQFCVFLTNCFMQSAYNFKVVFLIERTTLWQEFMMYYAICNRGKQWTKPSHLTELGLLFSVLAFLDASIGMFGLWFQCHSYAPMIRHQLWPFWANLDHRWRSSTPLERCPCNNLAVLEQSSLSHVSCLHPWFVTSYDLYERIRIIVERRKNLLSNIQATLILLKI